MDQGQHTADDLPDQTQRATAHTINAPTATSTNPRTSQDDTDSHQPSAQRYAPIMTDPRTAEAYNRPADAVRHTRRNTANPQRRDGNSKQGRDTNP